MPTPLPRQKPAGALVALFPAGRRPSPNYRRVGFRINRFGACSAFTRVPACMVAEPPKAASKPECFGPCRYLHEPPWPLPAGATVAGWVSHPPGKRAFPRRTVIAPVYRRRALQCQTRCTPTVRHDEGGVGSSTSATSTPTSWALPRPVERHAAPIPAIVVRFAGAHRGAAILLRVRTLFPAVLQVAAPIALPRRLREKDLKGVRCRRVAPVRTAHDNERLGGLRCRQAVAPSGGDHTQNRHQSCHPP